MEDVTKVACMKLKVLYYSYRTLIRQDKSWLHFGLFFFSYSFPLFSLPAEVYVSPVPVVLRVSCTLARDKLPDHTAVATAITVETLWDIGRSLPIKTIWE